MHSSFFQEQKEYTLTNICEKLGSSQHELIPIISKLKKFGILKLVKANEQPKNMSALSEIDIEIPDDDIGKEDYLYIFTFVGVVLVSEYVLKCYPKYLLTKQEPKEELCQVLKVLEKNGSNDQIVKMFYNTNENGSFNLLAVLLFLIHDYYGNGLYSNTEDIVKINGSGEILWDKTINETFTYISNNRPYYPELITKKRVNNETDYFKCLHECILTKISREMKTAELLDLFEFTEIELTDVELEDFGDTEYIVYRLEKELSTQFNTRKQLVLKALSAYLSNYKSTNETDSVSVFGTTSFNLVWEDVCANILGNQLECPLANLHLPSSELNEKYKLSDKLIDIIEKPYWTITGETATKTLIPDLITINDNQFIIFDAKYYTPILESGKTPERQPGIESVTKQFLYQLAYQSFIKDHCFSDVINCFLMPTEKQEVENKGKVTMKMFKDMNLKDIEVRYIPASTAYHHYLSSTKMDLSELQL